MSEALRSQYRPYYDAATFVSPAALPAGSEYTSSSFDYLDDASQAWLTDVGASAARSYLRVAVAQPFEVSKFLLQVSAPISECEADEDVNYHYDSRFSTRQNSYAAIYELGSEDEDEPEYFAGPGSQQDRKKTKRSYQKPRLPSLDPALERSLVPIGTNNQSNESPHITLESPSITDMLSALVNKDGPSGLWRALHTSYLYDVGSGVLAAYFGGILAGILGIPAESIAAIITNSAFSTTGDLLQAAADPRVALAAVAASLSLAHFVLAPVALIRARFMVMPFYASPSRSLRSALVNIRGWPPITSCALQIIAKLARKLPEIAAPWLLYTRFGLDMFSSPATYKLGKLTAQLTALVLALPLDTLAARSLVSALELPPQAMIIRPARYRGVLPSMWRVAAGYEPLSSLYRGWRLEVMGLASNWGYNALESSRPSKEHF